MSGSSSTNNISAFPMSRKRRRQSRLFRRPREVTKSMRHRQRGEDIGRRRRAKDVGAGPQSGEEQRPGGEARHLVGGLADPLLARVGQAYPALSGEAGGPRAELCPAPL